MTVSDGIRWYRRDDMDDMAGAGDPFRFEPLREAVDQLPDQQRHIIERTFFGGAPIQTAARELNVSNKYARELRTKALEALRTALLCDDEVGPLLSAALDRFAGRAVPIARVLDDAWCDAGPVVRGEDL